jgi:hypothetical protein
VGGATRLYLPRAARRLDVAKTSPIRTDEEAHRSVIAPRLSIAATQAKVSPTTTLHLHCIALHHCQCQWLDGMGVGGTTVHDGATEVAPLGPIPFLQGARTMERRATGRWMEEDAHVAKWNGRTK